MILAGILVAVACVSALLGRLVSERTAQFERVCTSTTFLVLLGCAITHPEGITSLWAGLVVTAVAVTAHTLSAASVWERGALLPCLGYWASVGYELTHPRRLRTLDGERVSVSSQARR